MFHKKTVRDVPLDGQIVLVRADYNVPLEDGKIADDYRITQSLPTLRYLLDRGCRLVICSHLGRPDGSPKPELSLRPIAMHLSDVLSMPVTFVPESVGDQVVQAVKNTKNRIVLLENLRFYPEEEANDAAFAGRLAKDSGAAYFIQDGFGVVHRAHASTAAVTQYLPSVAGLLLEREVATITQAMEHPERPLMAILGGAKVSDKIRLVERFVELADQLIIGGAMANTFLQYKGLPIGKSKYEPGQEAELERIYTKALQKTAGKRSVDEFILLPTDVAVSTSLEAEGQPPRKVVGVEEVAADDYILDIGTHTIATANTLLHTAQTVIWNGTLGMAEQPVFAQGSSEVASQLAAQKDTTLSIIGGGDTADFVQHWDKKGGSFGHVSTGGGASLELMAGDKLPGVEALMS